MPKNAPVFVSNSPVFNTLKGFEGEALAKYQPDGSPLASGYLLGSEYMNDYVTTLDVHHGAGHMILLGFQPQWLGQSMGTFESYLTHCYSIRISQRQTPSIPHFGPALSP